MQHSAQILDQKINHTIHKNPIFLSILIQNSKEQPDFLSDQTGKKKNQNAPITQIQFQPHIP
jgi:hypothetical protein